MAELTVIGVPSSAGAHHAGLELAPAALRERGLVDALRAAVMPAGWTVGDAGDVEGELFRADARDARPRNLQAVVRVATAVAAAVEEQARAGRVPVVVGGDCTVTVGAVAGLLRVEPDLAVAYLDGDADLNPPAEGGTGILDATGAAHLVGLADDDLARIGDAFPLLAPERLALLGYDPTDASSFRADLLDRVPGLRHVPGPALAADPVGATTDAVAALTDRTGPNGTSLPLPLLVHLDVDLVDSADLPLANYPHYGTGLGLDDARRALATALAAPRLAGVVLTEVNPTHDPGGEQLGRYVAALATAFGASRVRARAR